MLADTPPPLQTLDAQVEALRLHSEGTCTALARDIPAKQFHANSEHGVSLLRAAGQVGLQLSASLDEHEDEDVALPLAGVTLVEPDRLGKSQYRRLFTPHGFANARQRPYAAHKARLPSVCNRSETQAERVAQGVSQLTGAGNSES